MARIESGHKPHDSPKTVKNRSSESTNKWKIPHYYKRLSHNHSSSTSNNSNNLTDPPSFNARNTIPNMQHSPTINIMNSPKRVVLEGRNRDRSNSVSSTSSNNNKRNGKKKGKNDMVWVNYTVQDENPNGVPDQENFKNEMKTPVLSHEHTFQSKSTNSSTTSSPQVQPSTVQKSTRRRMLKIFSSSKDRKSLPTLVPSTDEASEALEESLSSSNIYPMHSNNTKKSYSSFLKYGKFGINTNSDNKAQILESNDCPEFVPRSKKDPSLAQPPVSSHSTIIINSVNSMTQSLKKQQQQQLQHNQTNMTSRGHLRSVSTDNFKMKPNGFGQIIPQYIEQKPTEYKIVEDNDASIAFSKLISRKENSLNKSTPALITPPSSGNVTTSNVSNGGNIGKIYNQRTASVTSLSSTGSRYSPIRTQSPARPRSSTRGSSVHRLSRDISNSYNINNALHDINPLLEGDTFLDSQYPTTNVINNGNGNVINNPKRVSVLSSTSSSNINKIGHRRKQESISDNYRFISTFSSNSQNASTTSITTPSNTTNVNPSIAVTPSGLLLTPPYVTPTLTQPTNSISTASTPSALEMYNVNSMNNGMGISSRQSIYNNNSNNGPSPQDRMIITDSRDNFTETIPSIKGIDKNENVINNNNNNNVILKNEESKNVDDLGNLLSNDAIMSFFGTDSSANSSGLESIMTNSLSTANSSVPVNAKNNNSLMSDNALFNGGNGNPNINMNANQTSKEDKLLQQMYLEFNFENPNMFNNNNDNNNNNNENLPDDMNTDFMHHKDTTVTSFENFSSTSAPSTVVETLNNNNNNSVASLINSNGTIPSMVNNEQGTFVPTMNNNNNDMNMNMINYHDLDEITNFFVNNPTNVNQ